MRKLVAVLALLALPLAAQDSQFFTAGKAALQADEPEKAAGFFEKAVAANPKNADYQFYLGAAYGNWAMKASIIKKPSLASKARTAFERAVQLDPRHWEARFGLITFYLAAPSMMGGSEEKALAQAAEMKKLDLLAGARAYARIYRSQKKPELARQQIIEAVRAMPNDAKAHYYLGGAYAIEKNWPAALHEYEMAIKLDPSFMRAWFQLGVHAAESGSNYARGEEALRKYLAYKPADDEPRHASAWYYLGQIFEKQGRKADAKNAYLTAQKLLPKPSKDITDALKRVS